MERGPLFQQLRSVTLRASRQPLARAALRVLYRAQLRIFVMLFRRDPAVSAVLLRRAGSLADLYPGDSDFDLLCIFEAAGEKRAAVLERLTRAYLACKRWLPVLGEIHFVRAEEFAAHFRYARHLYCCEAKPGWSYRSGRAPEMPPLDCVPEAYAVRAALNLYYRTASEILRPAGPQFSRVLLKNRIKTRWMLRQAAGERPGELSYCELDSRPSLILSGSERLGEIEETFTESANLAGRIVGSAKVRVRCTGGGQLDRPEVNARLASIMRPFVASHGARLRRCRMIQFRPYQFDPVLWVELREPHTWRESPEAAQMIAGLQDSLRVASPRWHHNTPLLTEEGWSRTLFRLDPMLGLLAEAEAYDFVTGRYHFAAPIEAEFPVDLLRCEVMAAIDGLSLEMVSGETQFLLDILFGRLIPARLALSEGVYPLDIRALRDACPALQQSSGAERELQDLYWRGDLAAIHQVSVFEVWRIFEKLISREIDEGLEAIRFDRR